MQIFIRPRILGNEMWGEAIRYLKVSNVQPHVLPSLKLYMSSCFIGMFFISFLACSKSLLGWVYNSSCPLTISIASLEWSFCPMGMVKSTNGFLVSFPTLIQMETSSLSNVLWSCNKTPSRVCLNIFD